MKLFAPVAENAAVEIRRLIADGALQPGDKIPSERELTQILGASRVSIRAALQELQAIGLLDVKPQRGTFIATDGAAGILTSIRGWFEANQLSLPELIEFRRAIEPAAAALAARHRDEDDLSTLRTHLDVMERSADLGDTLAFSGADSAFHKRIAAASRNRLFVVMTESLAETLRVYREAAARLGVGLLARALDDHRAVYAAIAAEKPDDAEKAMHHHIVNTVVDFRIIAREELA